MHDPMTQAFCIRYPWFRRVKWGSGRYHEEFLTIWHVDPERGGDDDSCDWSGGHSLTEAERDWLRKAGEAEHKFFFRGILKWDDHPDGTMRENARGDRWPGGMVGASSFEVLYGIAQIILWQMPGKNGPMHQQWFSAWRLRRALAAAVPTVLGLVCHSSDNLHHLIGEARACDDAGQKAMGELFVAVARNLRREARPWWRHPRWHAHHWSIQLSPWDNLKRWLTRRCADCGARFQWGYAPIYDSHGYHHHKCDGRAVSK
jgi:hypothetical protein